MYDLILKNAKCVVTPAGRLDGGVSVGVKDGKIAQIGEIDDAQGQEIVDCTGLHVLPGVIDTQVHFREPGGEHKEDLESGTRSAVAGGVTAIFEMPNTNPLTITRAAMQDKLDRAASKAWCDYGFFLGGSAENTGQIAELEKMPGVCGVKIFMGASTGNLLASEDDVIEGILRDGVRRVSIHAEDEELLNANKHLATSVDQHPVWRSEEVCRRATERILNLARKTGRKINVLHITTKQEPELLKQYKDVATMEVLVNHLTLSAPECYERLGSKAQQNPPVRGQDHQDALWRAVDQGIVDLLATDHAPHSLEEKAQDYPNSPSGMPGVQTLVPVMLTHVNNGKLSLERFVDLVSHGPNRVFQIAGKGRLAVGYDADFTIVDMAVQKTITNDWIESKCGWTPYDGMAVSAWPMATIIRGQMIMKDGELLKPKSGEAVRFIETLSSEGNDRLAAAA